MHYYLILIDIYRYPMIKMKLSAILAYNNGNDNVKRHRNDYDILCDNVIKMILNFILYCTLYIRQKQIKKSKY